ncbi:hypothetical protein L207DRAFT_231732 [Hyaloscypha variabilis F]|uniref:Uncharacterized protein n=1 Tax=Hyaloscypha variabilis (strain UAMH 11265 / GT02V1 / F) TaxID=1149755 RepID=A0A2J6QUD7_HYAVF|nr:hypothetical protein L207DRAFT_231732 [Hyaloscypha variabilis F]
MLYSNELLCFGWTTANTVSRWMYQYRSSGRHVLPGMGPKSTSAAWMENRSGLDARGINADAW